METVGRPGFASGSSTASDCAVTDREAAMNKNNANKTRLNDPPVSNGSASILSFAPCFNNEECCLPRDLSPAICESPDKRDNRRSDPPKTPLKTHQQTAENQRCPRAIAHRHKQVYLSRLYVLQSLFVDWLATHPQDEPTLRLGFLVIGQTISHYRIADNLGGGGAGRCLLTRGDGRGLSGVSFVGSLFGGRPHLLQPEGG